MGTNHKGFGNLQSASDLLVKLEHDLSRVKKSADDAYAAFDFFVTAEHMIDWLYPTDHIEQKRLRKEVRLLEIVSHLANGNKHFQALAKNHTSVEEVKEVKGGFAPKAFSTRAFDIGSFKFAGINIELNDGTYIHVIELAENVYEYWKKIIEKP